MPDASLPVVMLCMGGSCWQEGPSPEKKQSRGWWFSGAASLRLVMTLGIFNFANNADKAGLGFWA